MKKEVILIEELQNIIKNQTKYIDDKNRENNTLKETITSLEKEISTLHEKIDFLIRQQYQSKSEKLHPNQLGLFDDVPEDKETLPVEKDTELIEYTRKKGGRRNPPKDLPRVRVEHDIDESEKLCSCGCMMYRAKELISEQYDIVPARFQIIENVRFVYACRCGAKPKTTPVPPMIIPKSQVSASFLATVAVQKFEDALPLHRQVKIFKNRFGVPFTDTTLSSWMIKGSRALKPVMDLLRLRLLQNAYIQADETTLQVLKEEGRRASQKSYIWLGVGMDTYPVVSMHYADSRKRSVPTGIFTGFSGYLQTDGYAGYNQVVTQENITQLACWAHARRKFADIVKSGVSDEESKAYANEAVVLIRKLYQIEKEIKDEPPDMKYQIRQERSIPILNTIREWMDTRFFKAQQAGGAIAKAFVYLNNQFAKLKVYTTDGRLAIDNNRAENHIRPIALGRKNWLFATSVKGAEAVADWYSIIETAKLNGLEPYYYLKYLLTELPVYQREKKDIEALLPWNVDKGDLGCS
jgi:transposase